METSGNKQKRSVKSWRRSTRTNATRAGIDVLADTHKPVSPIVPYSAIQVQDYIEVPVVAIKSEYEDEDVVSKQRLGDEYAHQQEDPMTDIGSRVKEENDFIMETEEKFYEVTIKQELDIGPTVLQPETTSCPPMPSNQADACSVRSRLMLPSHSAALDRQLKQEPDLASNISRKIIKSPVRRCKEYRERKKLNQANVSAASDEEINSRKVTKTPAQRSKEYRERKKLRQAHILAASDEKANSRKVRKTPAQCSKEYRERKKLRQTNTSTARNEKVIKTPAQRSKEYRERKKLRQAQSSATSDKETSSKKVKKTPAQYSKEYRERKKLRQACVLAANNEKANLKKVIKTPAQRSKEYRQRKKYRKNLQLIKLNQITDNPKISNSTAFIAKEEFKKKRNKLSYVYDGVQEHFVEVQCSPLVNDINTDTSFNDSQEAMHLLKTTSDVTNFVKANEDQIPINEADSAINNCGNQTAKYSNYYQHSNGHLDFFEIFKSNTFGHSCAVCDRLWWEKDLKDTSQVHENILKIILPDYIIGTNVKVCSTCKIALDRQKIPTLSTYNGFHYPAIPSHLPTLDTISQRLISPRIPFMQIRRLRHVNGQYGIYAQIINVPLLMNTMVDQLPRNIDDDHCFYVRLEKKMIHDTSYVHGLVNKANIKEWLTYLVQTPLYTDHKITIDKKFFNDDRVHPEINVDDVSEHIQIEDNLTAQQQTLLWNEDKFLHMAPREKNNPISILFDGYAEELSFPTIYCGQFRKYREDIIVTQFMQATSELRRTDRRGVEPQHLLYMATKIMRQRVKDSVNTALKHLGNNTKIPKEQIQSNIANYIHNCMETNLAFLRCIPNSSWYWAEREKDLLAMVRQRGAPTAFMSLSANETGWTDLLKLLYRLKNNGAEISDQSLLEMSYVHKAKLVNEDAVTCAVYFNRLVNCILHVLQYKKRSPFGKYRVVDYFKRIEFQHGGSTHAHILLWLDNAPKELLNNDTDVTQMIDELVSVSAAEASENINLQTHKHAFACYKWMNLRNKRSCRFGAPFMPSRKTVALLPIKDSDGDHSEEQLQKYKCHYKVIQKNLENIDYTDFNHFYTHNNIESDEHYHNILRAGINRPRLFYRRTPLEKWHTPFNPFVLHHLKSSMDFQIVPDEHACATYVVEYMNKMDRGVGDFRRRLIETMNKNPEFDIEEIMKKASLDMVHSAEMSAQEAAWYLLREPMAKSTIVTAYIPTIQPVERQRIRKTIRDLNATDDDCADVWKENWFDKYERRPEGLSDVSLAQFVSKYYENKKGEYVERKEPRVIRCRNYAIDENSNDYKREMVLLHIPFRSEESDVLAEDKFVQIYEDNENLISQRRKEFELNSEIDRTVEIYRQLCEDEENYDDQSRNEACASFEADPYDRLPRDTTA